MLEMVPKEVRKGSERGPERKTLYSSVLIENPMVKRSKKGYLRFKVLIERDEYGFFVADIPALQGCHTQAKNIKELMKRVKEAINLCLEDEMPIIKQVDIKEIEIPYEDPKLLA